MPNYFPYGAFYMQYAFRDDSGFPMGDDASPNTVIQGETKHMQVLKNLVEVGVPAPTYELVTDRGGMRIRAQGDIGASALGEVGFQLSEFNDTFHAHLTGGALDSASPSGWVQGGMNVNNTARPRMIVMFTTKVEEIDEVNNTSSTKYLSWVYENCQIRPGVPGISQNSGVNPNPLQFTLVPSYSPRHGITGELLSAMAVSVQDDEEFFMFMKTSNPISVTTQIEKTIPDGSFVLGYRPLTDQTDLTDKFATDEGISTTITTCTPATGAVVLTAANTNDRLVFAYETAFTAI